MSLSVKLNGRRYRCTGYDHEAQRLTHDGDTCPIHEDESSPAYCPLLGRGLTPAEHEAAFGAALAERRRQTPIATAARQE